MTQPTQIPAGWHQNADGVDQWWDGYQWGKLRPPQNTLGGIGFTIGLVTFALNLIPYFVYLVLVFSLAGVIIGVIGVAMKPPRTLGLVGIGLAVAGIVVGFAITNWVRSYS
jgi:hypothetical protein